MRIGVPAEIKTTKTVAMTPAGVVHLIRNNHEVFIQKGAGLGSGFTDAQYVEAKNSAEGYGNFIPILQTLQLQNQN